MKTYPEIQPFIRTIHQQHTAIKKNAKMREEFTANVSHELKTPLTSISGYAELIETGIASGEDTIRFAGEIHKNSQRLLVLINDILRLSQLDSIESELEKEPVDLYEVAQNCRDMLENAGGKQSRQCAGGSENMSLCLQTAR
ncbi:MAG: HAMP domain-containing sensor histidine kinase [Eubacterium sp.]